jgi:membrane-bound ClpP family serine protease
MLAAIGAVLIILWLLGFLAFHVTVGAVHILLVIGLILIVMHLVRGSSATT